MASFGRIRGGNSPFFSCNLPDLRELPFWQSLLFGVQVGWNPRRSGRFSESFRPMGFGHSPLYNIVIGRSSDRPRRVFFWTRRPQVIFICFFTPSKPISKPFYGRFGAKAIVIELR